MVGLFLQEMQINMSEIKIPEISIPKIEINMPLIIRLAGTNVDKGNKILKDSKIDYIEAATLEEAANKAVNALKELES